MYYNDADRLRDCLLPQLFLSNIYSVIRQEPDMEPIFNDVRMKLERVLDKHLEGLYEPKRTKFLRRLYKEVIAIGNYMKENKFNTRKVFILLIEWTFSLAEANGILLDEEFVEVVEEFYNEIRQGFETIENFDKLYKSSLKHISKIHQLAIDRGIF